MDCCGAPRVVAHTARNLPSAAAATAGLSWTPPVIVLTWNSEPIGWPAWP
jgi:hypothetical protein